MKKFGITLILIGILIVMYPYISNSINDYEGDLILKNYEESIKPSVEKTNNNIIQYTSSKSNNVSYMKEDKEALKGLKSYNFKDDLTPNDTSTKEDNKDIKDKDNKIILRIDKIDVKLPVLEGITNKNLDLGLAHYEETSGPGEIGNFALAGHRSYDFGRKLNRLNEVEIGDEIKVLTPKGEYIYKIFEKFVVTPDSVWVLNDLDNRKTITLTTCHPIKEATHRLIVQGEIK